MSDTPKIYTCPINNTSTDSLQSISSISADLKTMGQPELAGSGEGKIRDVLSTVSKAIKTSALGIVSTPSVNPLGCMLNLQTCSPLSSQPSSAESCPDLNETRPVTRTCSSLVPSLLIEDPELVLYTSKDNGSTRRGSRAYQSYLCEEPVILRDRTPAYQHKYIRYMNRIASIDSVGLDQLSNESLRCLEGYLSPCYRRNAVHFINSYQRRVQDDRNRRARRLRSGLPAQPKLETTVNTLIEQDTTTIRHS